MAFEKKRIEGVGIAVQNWDEESSTQKHQLGTVWDLNDGTGDMFAYCKNGAVALASGKMVQGAIPVANHNEFTGGAGTVGALDSTEITIGQTVTTALTANEYDDGFIHTVLATGLGQGWRIKSHTTGVTPVFQLESFIRTALDTTTKFSFVANMYSSTVVSPTTPTAAAIGIPQIPVTASFYYWVKIVGLSSLLMDTGDTVLIGNSVGKPSTTALTGSGGLVGLNDHIYGTIRSKTTAGAYAGVYLNMLP